jgi:hypothetical protein
MEVKDSLAADRRGSGEHQRAWFIPNPSATGSFGAVRCMEPFDLH